METTTTQFAVGEAVRIKKSGAVGSIQDGSQTPGIHRVLYDGSLHLHSENELERVQKASTAETTKSTYEGFRPIAERAAARGQRPLPIIVGAKAPATKWKGSVIDVDTSEEWAAHSEQWINECAEKFPGAAVCVLAKPYEFCFIDEDECEQFRKGYEAFSGKSFPKTFTSESRSNHRQSHWLQTDATRKLGNIPQGDLVIASFRQANLYVLSEGSPHPKGGFYRIIDDTPAVPMPDDMVEFLKDLRRKTREAKTVAKETSKPAETEAVNAADYVSSDIPKLNDGVIYGKGDRNNRLSQFLYHRWVLQCCSEEELRRDAHLFNETKCDPPLPHDEVEQVIHGKLDLKQCGTGVIINGQLIPWPSADNNDSNDDDDDGDACGAADPKEQDPLQEEIDRNFPAYTGKAPQKPRMLIDGFLMGGTNFLGSLSGVGKTWVALAIAKSLITGESLFGVFPVNQITPILYLLPEDDEASFTYRLGLMRMPQNAELFRYRTISQGKTLPLTDKLTLNAIRYLHHDGKYPFVLVVVDTAIRFMETGRDMGQATNNTLSNDAENLRSPEVSADLLFLHHSPKSSAKGDMTLETVLRDTGDFGAMASAVFGLRRDEKLFDFGDGPEELDIINVKMRAPERPKPFRVRLKDKNGKSVIEQSGNLELVSEAERQMHAGEKLDAILRTNPEAGWRLLKDELRMGINKIKELGKSRGWSQKAVTTTDPKTKKQVKKFIWTQIASNDDREDQGEHHGPETSTPVVVAVDEDEEEQLLF